MRSVLVLCGVILAGVGIWVAAFAERWDSAPEPVESRPAPHVPSAAVHGATRATNPSEAVAAQPRPDGDGIGECPIGPGGPVTSPVVRSAVDGDGWPTWWHADGTITKKVTQTLRGPDGTTHSVPSVLRLSPGTVKGRGTQRDR